MGLPEATGCKAAKKFGNFSSGAWWDLSRGCRIRRGQVRRGRWARGYEPGRGLGRPGRQPCALQFLRMALRGKMTFQPLRPLKVNPGRLLGKHGVNTHPMSAAQLRGLPDSPGAELSLGICSRLALLVLVYALEEASKADSWGQRGLTRFCSEWELPQCPAGGPRFAAFSCGGRSWVGRSKFDTKPALSSFAGEWGTAKAVGHLCH